MVFSSIPFLFAFLPVVLAGYYIVPRRFRNVWLLVASLVFYTWGGGAFVLILVFSSTVNFVAGRHAYASRLRGDMRGVRFGVALAVIINIGLLAYFKYANFLVEQMNSVASSFGFGPIAWTSVALPIGISFFTFQSMSYTIDLATERGVPLKRFRDFLLYVSLFPQLIAGPIVRFHEIADDLRSRRESVTQFAEGALRFSHGLVKKVVIADSVAVMADVAFGAAGAELSFADAWVGVLAYTIQIYFDFSGYSDMAIGLGLMLGFSFPENFRRPYSAISVTDFWRRWHITLSNWFRDYLYIPLGGGRVSTRRTYVNLVVVFFLTGLWHGANWTFVFWGMYHGVLMIIERVAGLRPVGDSSVSWERSRRSVVLLLVMVGWVMFRSPSIGAAADYLAVMISWDTAGLEVLQSTVSTAALVGLAVGTASLFLPRTFAIGPLLADAATFSLPVRIARWAVVLPGLAYASIVIAGGSFSPFLYFQF